MVVCQFVGVGYSGAVTVVGVKTNVSFLFCLSGLTQTHRGFLIWIPSSTWATPSGQRRGGGLNGCLSTTLALLPTLTLQCGKSCIRTRRTKTKTTIIALRPAVAAASKPWQHSWRCSFVQGGLQRFLEWKEVAKVSHVFSTIQCNTVCNIICVKVVLVKKILVN